MQDAIHADRVGWIEYTPTVWFDRIEASMGTTPALARWGADGRMGSDNGGVMHLDKGDVEGEASKGEKISS